MSTSPRIPVLLYTVDQVAESLQISPRTADYLVASGQIRSITVGRSRRVNADDLAEFAAHGAAVIIK